VRGVDDVGLDSGATAGQIILGVLGSALPPIGIIHGLVIWASSVASWTGAIA